MSDDLQDLAPFDMESLYAEVAAKIGDDPGDDVLDEDEAGPSQEEGELTDDDLDATEDEDFEESDEGPDEDAGASEEEGESDGDADLPDPDGVEPEAEAKADPRDEKISRLESLVLQTQQQNQQLADLLLKMQQESRKEAPKASPTDLSEEVAHLALFSGDPEALKALDPATRAKAMQHAQEWTKAQARYSVDPSLFYKEKIRDLVLADLQNVVGPVLQQHATGQAQAVIDQHLAGMDPSSRKRVAEVFQGLGSPTESALKFAVDFVKKETAEQKLAERERKLAAAERQKKANREAARRSGRPGRRPAKKDKRPKWQPGEDLADYARRLQQQ